MSRLWDQIRNSSICEPLPLSEPYGEVLVTRDVGQARHWLIGPHPRLTALARQLRHDAPLCHTLRKRGVQFGFRVSGEHPTDVPPLSRKWLRSYGTMEPRTVVDHTNVRQHPGLPPARAGEPAPTARYADEFKNVEAFWAARTPEAHHLVEFGNLEAAGLSSEGGVGDLDYKQLPCVLLMAEFHQRYVSSHLKPTHAWAEDLAKKLTPSGPTPVEKKPAAKDYLKRLRALYQKIYRHCAESPLISLWEVAELILNLAEHRLDQQPAKS